MAITDIWDQLDNQSRRIDELQAQVDAIEELIVNNFVAKPVDPVQTDSASQLGTIKLG